MLSSARALGIPAPLALFITRTPAIFIPAANQVLRVTRVINILLRHIERHVYVTRESSISTQTFLLSLDSQLFICAEVCELWCFV